MKKFVILLILVFIPTFILAQTAGGAITRPSHKSQVRKTSNKISKQQILQNLIANMVYVEGGTFNMGATSEQGDDAEKDEVPIHQVTLSSFYIGKYEVTQEEWVMVMGKNPSRYKGSRFPVGEVSWDDCQIFISKLNKITGKNFRLPTEAEWEFAARGGTKSKYYKYAGSNSADIVAWHQNNSWDEKKQSFIPHQVGQKLPNELGVYDMSGNVWEWCSDWYGDYPNNSVNNPQGGGSGQYRVRRGGSYSNIAKHSRLSSRTKRESSYSDSDFGLRLVEDRSSRDQIQ